MDIIAQNYWALSCCGRALFLAAPFGYGPRVAAETLARRLQLQLDDWNQSETLPTPSCRLRIVFNFGCENAPRFECTYNVWIDCLVWLRSGWPDTALNYDLILAETFFEQNRSLYTPEQLRHISPLLDSPGITANPLTLTDYILVSFGGVDTPFTQEIQRFLLPSVILEALVKSVRERGSGEKIVCCVPEQLRNQLGALAEMSAVTFLSPDHNFFIQLLKNATLYVVQPGLYGPFEAFERQIPTVFCTPFSYTQILQARRYENLGLLGEAPLWSELDGAIGPLQGNVDLEEANCFRDIADWLRLNQGRFAGAFHEWAQRVVAGSVVTGELTSKRSEHARSCSQFSDEYLKDLLIVLARHHNEKLPGGLKINVNIGSQQ